MDKLAAMRLLVRVVQTESFARGAQAEGISTATATQRINNYEQVLGVKLLHRNTRGVSLTEQGEICYQSALRILGELEQLDQTLLAGQMDAAGIVRVNCNAGIGRAILLPALASFSQRFPAIKLHLVLSDSRAQFVRDKVDFSIRIDGLEDQDLLMRSLGKTRRITVASPGYLQQFGTPVTPGDLSRHQLIDFLLPDSSQTLPWMFRDHEPELFNGHTAINDAQARVQMAVQGLGIVQTPAFMCASLVKTGALQRVLQEWEVDTPAISILYPRNRHLSHRVKLALDFCAELITRELLASDLNFN